MNIMLLQRTDFLKSNANRTLTPKFKTAHNLPLELTLFYVGP